MLAIQPRRVSRADEELRAVGVGAGIGHGQGTEATMLETEIFIGELLTIDRFATRAISTSEVTTLQHETRDHAMNFDTQPHRQKAHSQYTTPEKTKQKRGMGVFG